MTRHHAPQDKQAENQRRYHVSTQSRRAMPFAHAKRGKRDDKREQKCLEGIAQGADSFESREPVSADAHSCEHGVGSAAGIGNRIGR